jgi:hypothetical protein
MERGPRPLGDTSFPCHNAGVSERGYAEKGNLPVAPFSSLMSNGGLPKKVQSSDCAQRLLACQADASKRLVSLLATPSIVLTSERTRSNSAKFATSTSAIKSKAPLVL